MNGLCKDMKGDILWAVSVYCFGLSLEKVRKTMEAHNTWTVILSGYWLSIKP